jgi:hypothetical protein
MIRQDVGLVAMLMKVIKNCTSVFVIHPCTHRVIILYLIQVTDLQTGEMIAKISHGSRLTWISIFLHFILYLSTNSCRFEQD